MRQSFSKVEISQLKSISRCLISPCKSLLVCNVFNFFKSLNNFIRRSHVRPQDNICHKIPSHVTSRLLGSSFTKPLLNKNHFVNFAGTAFVMATHVEGSFSSTSLSGDMKIVFYCKYSLEMKTRCNE